MTAVGTFQITGSFVLTGRGFIIVGDLTSGMVSNGDFVTVETELGKITAGICSVETGRATHKVTDIVGLVLEDLTEPAQQQLRSVLLHEQDVEILRGDGAAGVQPK